MNTPFEQNTEGKKRFHLTFTGLMAGQTLCGFERVPEERYFHAMYAPKDSLTDPRMCKTCLSVWNDEEAQS